MKNRIYLDYNATAQIKAPVIERMCEVMANVGNPSSVHAAGRDAKMLIEKARAQIASLVGVGLNSVIFTGSGTESNNMAIRGVNAASMIHSNIEHDSILAIAKVVEMPVYVTPVDEHGLIDMLKLDELLAKAEAPAIVSIMLANNETGVIQPISDIAQLVHKYDGLLHCDCMQAVGKIFIEFSDLGADMISITGHKMGGPQGVGALIVRPDLPLKPLIVGGGQEQGRRSGTENVAGIVGLGLAAELAEKQLPEFMALETLRDDLENRILKLAPDAKVWSRGVPRLPNTLSVSMAGVSAETQVMHMDLAGIAVSSGSACGSGKVKGSHVLEAMGGGTDGYTLRISLGLDTTQNHIDEAFEAWRELYERMQKKSSEG